MPRQLEAALRTIASLPAGNWLSGDRASFESAKRVVQDHLGKIDRKAKADA